MDALTIAALTVAALLLWELGLIDAMFAAALVACAVLVVINLAFEAVAAVVLGFEHLKAWLAKLRRNRKPKSKANAAP